MQLPAYTLALALIVVSSAVTILAIQPSERNTKPSKNGEGKSTVAYPLEGIREHRFAFKGKWTGVLKVEVAHSRRQRACNRYTFGENTDHVLMISDQ